MYPIASGSFKVMEYFEDNSTEYFSAEEFEEDDKINYDQNFEYENNADMTDFYFKNIRSSIITTKHKHKLSISNTFSPIKNVFMEEKEDEESNDNLVGNLKKVRFAEGTFPPQQTSIAVTIYAHEYIENISCIIYKIQVNCSFFSNLFMIILFCIYIFFSFYSFGKLAELGP